MFLFQVNEMLSEISCADEDEVEAVAMARASVDEVQYLIRELTEREADSADRSGMSDLKTEAYYWDGSRDAYAYILNILKNFLKKVEKN